MSYSACDFADDIYGAFDYLEFPDADDDDGDLAVQSETILAEVQRLRRIEKALRHALGNFDDGDKVQANRAIGAAEHFVARVRVILADAAVQS